MQQLAAGPELLGMHSQRTDTGHRRERPGTRKPALSQPGLRRNTRCGPAVIGARLDHDIRTIGQPETEHHRDLLPLEPNADGFATQMIRTPGRQPIRQILQRHRHDCAIGAERVGSPSSRMGHDGTVSDSMSDVDVALAAAAAGTAVVRAAYGGILTRHMKSASDFATDADLDAERAILDVIATARPDDRLVGEETGEGGGSGSRRWLVDPLCGTLNFAAQTPLFAVNVALLADSRTLVSVLADPIAGEVFWSDGARATVQRGGNDEPLRPSAESRLVDVNCDGPVDRPFVGPQLLCDPAFRSAFGPRVLSTTLAVAWVAAGRRAAYVSDGMFVDSVHFAAGIGLCRAAGCIVTDLTGGALESGRGLIVAADSVTHERLVDIVRPHLESVLHGGQ